MLKKKIFISYSLVTHRQICNFGLWGVIPKLKLFILFLSVEAVWLLYTLVLEDSFFNFGRENTRFVFLSRLRVLWWSFVRYFYIEFLLGVFVRIFELLFSNIWQMFPFLSMKLILSLNFSWNPEVMESTADLDLTWRIVIKK